MYSNIGISKLMDYITYFFTLRVLTCKFLKKFLAIFLILFSFSIVFMQDAKANTGETLETIFDTITSITCETQGIGDLLKPEFAHTCIPAPFFTFLVANVLSPGLYANTVLRVTMNDSELFPKACYRGNRADFDDPRLSFSMCNNIKLQDERLKAIGTTVGAILEAMVTGKNPWEEIKDSWLLPKSDYHNIFNNKKEGDHGIMYDIGVIPVFPWKVIKRKDRICVATQSFAGWIPVGCKYIKEPFPVSIYADFLDISPGVAEDSPTTTTLTHCANMGTCYKRAYDNSRTGIVMTGPLIECVKEMIAKLMISTEVCGFDDVEAVLGSNERYTSALFTFQKNMHTIVSSLLTIYIILFGFKVLLAGDIPPKSELMNFVIKFIFVVYFSVGININYDGGSELDRMDGMIQWAFPFLLNGMTQMASWMMSASPSELCVFNDVYYPDNLQHLQLWDALDCKISHYIGLDTMQTMVVENAHRHHNWERFDVLSFPIPPYIFLLVPALISGNFMLISLALMYPLLVISVAAFVVNATVVCMISIVVLGTLAPLFVPLYLFEYTKGYFEAWVKLLISFLLQPMVAVVFLTTMFAVYDFGFYGTCKYEHKDLSYSGPEFTVKVDAGIASASANLIDNRLIRYYYVDQDWDKYTSEEAEGCINSLGFILNNPLQFAFSTGAELLTAQMPWLDDPTGAVEKGRFDFLGAMKSSTGIFFSAQEIIFEKIKILLMAMFTASFFLYLMYHFSESLAEFAADMTEGVSISNMSIKPQSLFKAGMSAVSQAEKGMSSKDSAATGQNPLSQDRASTARVGASDKVSTARAGASDKVSTGSAASTSAGRGSVDKVSGSALPSDSVRKSVESKDDEDNSDK